MRVTKPKLSALLATIADSLETAPLAAITRTPAAGTGHHAADFGQEDVFYCRFLCVYTTTTTTTTIAAAATAAIGPHCYWQICAGFRSATE